MPKSKIQISEDLDIGLAFLFLDQFRFEKQSKTTSQYSESRSGSNWTPSSEGVGRYKFLPDPLLLAHFLSKPVVPASLILESILQNTALTIYSQFSLPKGVHALVIKIEMDVKSPVSINQEIEVVSKIQSLNRGIIRATAETHSGSMLIAKAILKYWCPEASKS